ncbi:hypothetical protein [Chitinophaga japonensis]|uniref:Uncharacterized protein n=1 Tax=Chitinophaga japonensis TaxID=104662 RepID=A0A562SZT0_CHIJA|nr:hypothetical protein [Chitinophaga japonensis]TWI86336.1 hypothetical protein LX66_3590 [Chitinophaga japonensis]
MDTQIIHTIITAGTTYMIAGTALALFGLYKMGFHKMVTDFFTGKSANNG